MMMVPNRDLGKAAFSLGPIWKNVPMNTVRLATIIANARRRIR